MAADLTALMRRLRRAGYRTERTRGGHWRVRDADGRLVAVTSGTPGDWRTVRNLRAALRRAGVRAGGKVSP